MRLKKLHLPVLRMMVLGLGLIIGPGASFSQTSNDAEMSVPPELEMLQTIERDDDFDPEESVKQLIDIRMDALREAAISYGARGGLARRTYEIRQTLKAKSTNLNKIFDFRRLLIAAPSGFLIEPPIISEAVDNMLIDARGTEAAVADRIFNIGVNAKIVSAPRTWNQYLERSYNEVDPPPQILRPKDAQERKKWKRWVEIGWENGVEQADEIFQADLARLQSDFEGMVRYRKLLAQGMVSAPYALENDRGITGGGSLLRIGDRSVRLTGLPQLKPGYEEWRPASR